MRAFFLSLLAGSILAGCGPKYVRQSDVPDIDEAAMSTRLDRKDLDQLFQANIENLLGSPQMAAWQKMTAEGKKPVVAIFPIKNDTSEHIDTQLSALLSKMETRLVSTGAVSVVSHERQRQLAEEMRVQESAVFDPAQAARMGRMLGAKFFVTGKIYDNTEMSKKRRRVQYFLFMQAVETETSLVGWQNEAELTKGLVK
ncbi:MAG: penicillin-binding protein activator LpoB [Elusimicrobiota bacterium]